MSSSISFEVCLFYCLFSRIIFSYTRFDFKDIYSYLFRVSGAEIMIMNFQKSTKEIDKTEEEEEEEEDDKGE